jgi:hypothetical protein
MVESTSSRNESQTNTRRSEARPVFVIGSPRSGTSILTWAIGQHPNILVTEESDWIGPFALQAAAQHAVGSERGERSQLGALGITRAEFMAALGGAIDAQIRGHRQTLERRNHAIAERDPNQVNDLFAVARANDEPKARWVDGTPEYSLHVAGLLALFPAAKFVHILRDVDEVAASMLAFRQGDGAPLVADANAAYAYWQRAVSACVAAENALGADVVHRVRHADLIAAPEAALRGVLDFLGEPFDPHCVAPLQQRINSSFADETTRRERPMAQSPEIDAARRLCVQWSGTSQAAAIDREARARLDADFEERVAFVQSLPRQFRQLQSIVKELKASAQSAHPIHEYEFVRDSLQRTRRVVTACGIFLAAIWLVAFAAWWSPGHVAAACVLLVASGATLLYAWLRRAGLRALLARVFGMQDGKGSK